MRFAAHPLAELIPAMTTDQFSELCADIARQGLIEPIVLHDHLVLDGRHRLRACEETGVEPRFEEFNGLSPAEYVISKNVKRRHLTVSQRAALVTAFLPALEAEAKARQTAAGRIHGRGTDSSGPMGPELSISHRAADDAAALVGVSRRTVSRTKRVQQEDPEMFEQVQSGELSVRAAETALHDEPNPKPRISKGSAPTRSVETLAELTEHYRTHAESSRRRVNRGVASIAGLSTGLVTISLINLQHVVPDDEAKHWHGELRRIVKELRQFDQALTEARI